MVHFPFVIGTSLLSHMEHRNRRVAKRLFFTAENGLGTITSPRSGISEDVIAEATELATHADCLTIWWCWEHLSLNRCLNGRSRFSHPVFELRRQGHWFGSAKRKQVEKPSMHWDMPQGFDQQSVGCELELDVRTGLAIGKLVLDNDPFSC